MTDIHCHIDDVEIIDEILEKCKSQKVNRIVISGYDNDSNEIAVELANKYEMIYATIGYHPDVLNNNFKDENLFELKRLIKNPKVIAIGEIGLDYYWNKENKKQQIELFNKQIDFAIKHDKPIIIHCREAIDDCYKVLKNQNIKPFIMHCYSGSLDMAKKFINIGGYLSIGGVCTFKNAKNIVDVIKEIPLEYILLETDSPYLTPEPYRGTKNYSFYIPIIANKIANIKGIAVDKVSYMTDSNFKRIFDL